MTSEIQKLNEWRIRSRIAANTAERLRLEIVGSPLASEAACGLALSAAMGWHELAEELGQCERDAATAGGGK